MQIIPPHSCISVNLGHALAVGRTFTLKKASNLQAESNILKKIIGTPNLSIKTKNFQKKLCFVP
jgi:hypothetical protein